MNLPFSYDRIETQVINYPQNNPPCVPRVELCPEADPILIYACSEVANEAGRLATSSQARVFCYNMLSANNWNNAQFADVVKYSLDACVLKMRQSMAPNAASFLRDSVCEVLALYTGMLVCSFPDLARVLPQEQIAAAGNNHRIYMDLVEDSKMLYMNQMPYQAPVPAANRFTSSQQFRQQQFAQPAAANPVGRSAYGNAETRARLELPVAFRKRTAPKPENPESDKIYIKTPEPKQIIFPSEVLTGDIENMDRQAHSIPYAGRNIPQATAPIRRKMEEAVEMMEANASNVSEEVGVNVNPVILPALYYDELISTAHAHWMSTVPSDSLDVYLRHGWVMTPIAGSIPLKGVFAVFAKSATFAALASDINRYVDSIEDKALLRSTLIFVTQMDRLLTNILNGFLIPYTDPKLKIRSSSFLEDASDMPVYLNDRLKGTVNNAYNDYQRRVMCKLFANIRGSADDLEDYRETYDNENGEFMTQAYSMIYINATAPELGYAVGAQSKDIEKTVTPLLYRLLAAAFEYDKKRDTPANHVIILADASRYNVFLTGYAEDSSPKFQIREA